MLSFCVCLGKVELKVLILLRCFVRVCVFISVSVCVQACVSVWLTPPTHVAPTLAFLSPQPTGYGHEWTHSPSLLLSVSHTLFLSFSASLSLQELTLTSKHSSALLPAATHTVFRPWIESWLCTQSHFPINSNH